ncbi:uncharacterized protein LOC108248793 [Kryptolebias marmoratus]|uniref:uncharacterized protein LOC108248793 n=1 Tax=Kryptolebias marmoratus TaxID=37003 RepID=UPI0007F91BA8|nr:uncharacterized protein LOC108248793 [Kryptolebias marmoratus]
MPCLTVVHPRGQGVIRGYAGDGDGKRTSSGTRRSLNRTSAEDQPKQNLLARSLRTFGVVCFVLLLEALLQPSLSPEDVCCRLSILVLLWVLLGACLRVLKRRLEPENPASSDPRGRSPAEPPLSSNPSGFQVEPPPRNQQVVLSKSSRNLFSGMSRTQNPVPLSMALTDGLLLCVLQELLQEPSVEHIQALLNKLQAVAQTLENAGTPLVLEEVDRDATPTDKLKLLCSYLQQRTGLLASLVKAQQDFQTSVGDLLRGLQDLWVQLEELHAGVTLTKREDRGHRDLASVQKDAEALVAELGRYRLRFQSCEAHLKESTRLLQELTWSHAHVSSEVNAGGSESVWPELLLQSNIEQFDSVQESLAPLEQQTATFRTHLEGLGGGNPREGGAGGAPSSTAPPQTSSDTPPKGSSKTPSLRGRMALKVPSLRLPKPGNRK